MTDETGNDRLDGTGENTDAEDVHHTYDRIAEHFSKTREYPWPEVETFLADRSAAVGVDVGCGNGRHTEVLADHANRVLGVDASRGLLAEARERATERGFDAAFVAGDAASLPVRDDAADLAVYVATIHHLDSRTARVASLDELARVLAPGGAALVSAWSTEHDRFDGEASEHDHFDGEASEHDHFDGEASEVPDRRADDDRGTATTGFDTTVDWTLPGGETVPRYYHIYDPAEFRADLDASALAVEDAFVSSGNCYAVVVTR